MQFPGYGTSIGFISRIQMRMMVVGRTICLSVCHTQVDQSDLLLSPHHDELLSPTVFNQTLAKGK